MTSVIRSLVQQYRNRVIEQAEWSVISETKLHQTLVSKKIGELLLSLIGLSCSQKEVEKNRSKLLQNLKNKQKEQSDVIEKVLGIFMIELMKKDHKFSSIYRELDLLFEPDIPEEETFDFNSQEEDNETSVYSNSTQSSKMSNFKQNLYTKLVEQQSFVSYNESQLEDSSHERRVSEYISKLSAPQTQVSYLCQHFGWRSNFGGSILPNGDFEVLTEIDFEFKNFKKLLTAKANFKNKKVARMLSAAKLLRNLYISFPQIWKLYSKIRDEKSLIIPEDGSKQNLIKQAIKEKVEIVKVEKPKQEDFQKQLKNYVGGISSFKAELNILLQQVTGVFNHPKMEKLAFENKWKVKGELHMTIRQTGQTKIYSEVEINLNSKLAEENIAKKLLTNMYRQHRDILELMAMLKKKKGFKT